ncbi:MAG: hypothetical protein ABSD29_14235 [Verrucomicrobiota bacterium]|jgi:hypothetical protein
MIRIPAMAVLLTGLASAAAGTDPSSPDKVPSTRDFGDIRREVETLRGKKFVREVPVYAISEKELRAISDHDLDKEFPGRKLRGYEELLAWLDMVPPHTDLKSVYADYLADQVAGLYDSDAKEMCIPSFSGGTTNAAKRATEKKLAEISSEIEDIVLAHEFTHALEDQYWPLDDPQDHDFKASTDRGTAHDFVTEGSATREMIEVIPAQWGRESVGGYFLFWNLIHSGLGELVLNYALSDAWKSSDALVAGVPEPLARTEAMPYSFGYCFCTKVMRKWGLDGLDYIYNHPPVSSAQVMHPKKCWEWRDLPVQINLPETLPGDWNQVSLDSVGEAGMAVLFGCQFKNLNHGLELARGWDGDHVAFYEGSGGHRLLLWASAWDSTNAAGRYVGAWVKERQAAHQAVITENRGNRIEWERPDGGAGLILRNGKRVILLETDDRETLQDAERCAREVTFVEPPEDAVRAAANSPLRRFNPLWSWQKDGDYAVTRSLGGLLWRHDRNSVGAADRFLLGLLAESRRTTSFHKWELGGGLVARHESEARRGITKTTVLPWGVLASHCSARLPQSPGKTIMRTSVLWGLGGSVTMDGAGCHSVHVLPFGLFLRRTTGPGQSSIQVLGTGLFRKEATNHSGSTARFRLLGIPIWTTHTSPPQNR